MKYKLSGIGLVFQMTGLKSLLWQIGLITLAVALPAVAHILHLPVRWLLPMHWPIILAGLIFGWRSGMLVGLAAPLTNYLITGYPMPLVLLPMTVELMVYGFITGWLRENTYINIYWNVGIALIAGRVVFVLSVLLTKAFGDSLGGYLIAAMLPGIAGGLGQIFILPKIALYLLREKS